jgi:hypothetical protein
MTFQTDGRSFIRSKWDAILDGSLILLCAASLAFHDQVRSHNTGTVVVAFRAATQPGELETTR